MTTPMDPVDVLPSTLPPPPSSSIHTHHSSSVMSSQLLSTLSLHSSLEEWQQAYHQTTTTPLILSSCMNDQLLNELLVSCLLSSRSIRLSHFLPGCCSSDSASPSPSPSPSPTTEVTKTKVTDEDHEAMMDEALESSSTESMVATMSKSWLSGSIILHILSTHDCPRRWMREEYIAPIIQFIHHLLTQFILPLYDQTAREKFLLHLSSTVESSLTSSLQLVEHHLRFLVHKTCNLIDQFVRLLAIEKISSTLTSTLFEDAATILGLTTIQLNQFTGMNQGELFALIHRLQTSSGEVIQRLFLSGDFQTRKGILDHLVDIYRDLNPMRRNLRTYTVHQGIMTKSGADGSGIKKEESFVSTPSSSSLVTPSLLADDDLSDAIGSSIPLPSAAIIASDTSQSVTIQFLTALICQLFQSLTTEPLQRDQAHHSSTTLSLLDRIKAEVNAKEVAERLAAEEATAAAAATKDSTSVGSSVKKSKRGKKVIDSSDSEQDTKKSASKKKGSKKGQQANMAEDVVEMVDAAAATAVITPTAADLSRSIHGGLNPFNTELDTPQLRDEFITTVAAPLTRVNDLLKIFVSKLLTRIQPPLNSNSSSMITVKTSRLLLKNWIEDLLQILFTPEFPIAEEIVCSFVRMLIPIVDPKPSQPNQYSDRFKLSCLSALALITIHFKRHASLAQEHPIMIRPKRLLPNSSAAAGSKEVTTTTDDASKEDLSTIPKKEVVKTFEVLHCVCEARGTFHSVDELEAGGKGDLGFLIDCDECHTWYHGRCVGVPDADNIPPNWHCLNCVIRLECERQTEELTKKRERLKTMMTAAFATTANKKSNKKGSPSTHPDISPSPFESAIDELSTTILADNPRESAKVGSSVLKQLLINYLDREYVKSKDEIVLAARQCYLAQWMQQTKLLLPKSHETPSTSSTPSTAAATVSPSTISAAFEGDLELIQINFEPPHSIPASSLSSLWMTREMAIRISRQLHAERRSENLLQTPSQILQSLYRRTCDPSPKYRAASIAALADIVRVDPIALKVPMVKKALYQRVNDPSISVREAVMDLIGTHISQAQTELNRALSISSVKLESNINQSSSSTPNSTAITAITNKYSLNGDYFRYFLHGLNDSGISVRKKVLRIMRDLCLQPYRHPRILDMCQRLISCLRDPEESMQSLSVTTIYEMWFDKKNPIIKDRTTNKLKPMKDEPMAYAQDRASASSSATGFTSQFENVVHLIISVIQQLYGPSYSVTSNESLDALIDILTLLLDQESQLSKSTQSGEMTSLSGLKLSLLKVSREQRKKQTRVTTKSSLTQTLNSVDKPTKRRQSSLGTPEDSTSMYAIYADTVQVIINFLVDSGCNSAPSLASNANVTVATLPPPTRRACIEAIHVFSQVDPTLILPHRSTLLTYLSLVIPSPQDAQATPTPTPTPTPTDKLSQEDIHTVLLLLEIFHEVLCFIDSPSSVSLPPHRAYQLQQLKQDRPFVAKLESDIRRLLQQSTLSVLMHAAIPTLAKLTEKLSHSNTCAQLAKTFFAHLWYHLKSKPPQLYTGSNIRPVLCLGLLVKHVDLEGHYAALNANESDLQLPPRLSFWHEVCTHASQRFPKFQQAEWMSDSNRWNQIIDPIFDLFKFYLRALHSVTDTKLDRLKAIILQSILAIFSRKPTLIPQSKEIIDMCLKPPASTWLQQVSLQYLREFLQTEDRRVSRTSQRRQERVKEKVSTKPTKKKSSKRKGKQDGDDSEEEEVVEDIIEVEDDEEMDGDTHEDMDRRPSLTSQKSWVDSTIDASDFLPPMVSMCENYVYQFITASHPSVRSEALQFMHVFLRQGVTNPIDAMPPLIAALTDRQPAPHLYAVRIVNELVADRVSVDSNRHMYPLTHLPQKEFMRSIEQRFGDGIRLSYQAQEELVKTFDPLHRINLSPAGEEPSFDLAPSDGISAVYSLLKKSVVSRKIFCRLIGVELLSVDHIGIFARENEVTPISTFTSPNSSPIKPLEPHPTLNKRTNSLGSMPESMSPMEPATPGSGSQFDDFPAFVPPILSRASTPKTISSPFVSPSSSSALTEMSGPNLLDPTRPINPLGFLAYVARMCTGLTFEDDEPFQLCVHLSKVINTRGASLQAQMQQTILTLKKLNGEHLTEMEEEEVATAQLQLAQPIESEGTQLSAVPTPHQDKASLLHSLQLQCQSAMAISILIQFRQWLQKSYELDGLFEAWNLSVTQSSKTASSNAPATRAVPFKVTKKLDLNLHFNLLPLEPEKLDSSLLSAATDASLTPSQQQRHVAGKTKLTHARHQSAPPTSTRPIHSSSIIPPIAQAQFTYFNTSMERESLFLKMKSTKRGHKRAATTGGLNSLDEDSDETGAPKKKARRVSVGTSPLAKPKKKSQTRKKRKFTDDTDSDGEDDVDEDDDYDDDSYATSRRSSVPGSGGSRGGGAPQSSESYAVESILGERVLKGRTQFKIKWEGYEETTWEFEKNLLSCTEALKEFRSKSFNTSGPPKKKPRQIEMIEEEEEDVRNSQPVEGEVKEMEE